MSAGPMEEQNSSASKRHATKGNESKNAMEPPKVGNEKNKKKKGSMPYTK